MWSRECGRGVAFSPPILPPHFNAEHSKGEVPKPSDEAEGVHHNYKFFILNF